MTVVHWPMNGVWPSWVMQSWSSPVQSPSPSSTAKAAGEPSVQVLHSDRISVSLVGSKLTMMGLIFRPLIPPLSLICLTKRSMALVCSPNSTSAANPSLPASELRATTGKTTLMVCLVTPRDEVLAELTGLGPAGPPLPPVGCTWVAPGAEEADGDVATHTVVPTMTAPTSTTVRIWVERGRRTK